MNGSFLLTLILHEHFWKISCWLHLLLTLSISWLPNVFLFVSFFLFQSDFVELWIYVEKLTNWSLQFPGKNKDQLPSDKAMEFDPIRQHRHFCPWIASTGNSPPGWQKTLSALQHQKEFFCPSSPNASSSSLIEVI